MHGFNILTPYIFSGGLAFAAFLKSPKSFKKIHFEVLPPLATTFQQIVHTASPLLVRQNPKNMSFLHFVYPCCFTAR